MSLIKVGLAALMRTNQERDRLISAHAGIGDGIEIRVPPHPARLTME